MDTGDRFDRSDLRYRHDLRKRSPEVDRGSWHPVQTWTTPFTIPQQAALRASYEIIGDSKGMRVHVVRTRPAGECEWVTIELPATLEELVGEDEVLLGVDYEVQFGVMTRGELDSLPEFTGW